MNWYKVAEFPAHENLQEVYEYFNQKGVVHRFTENRGVQELWLADERSVTDAKAFVAAWQRGDIQLEATPANKPHRRRGGGTGMSRVLRAYPLTLTIIILGIAGYAVATLVPQRGWLWALTFQNFYMSTAGLMYEPAMQAWQRGEIWRLITPTFLHFGLLHIVFNGLWIWEFGRRLEAYFSRVAYLTLFFVTAIGANIVQYVTVSNAPFGGLSGVVYGYMGVLFVASRIAPSPVLAVPPGIFGFMLIWLALGVLGVIDLFIPGPGGVGNGAHLGGLLFGLVLGYILLNKTSRRG